MPGTHIINANGTGGGSGAASATGTFTNADLAAGLLVATHSLASAYPNVQIIDSASNVVIPDDINSSGTNTMHISLTSFGAITGTWRWRANP